MSRLAGKVAFITGAGSGIGRAAACLFAKEGARVVVADIASPSGQETVRLVRDGGGQAAFVETDVGEPHAVENAVRTAVDLYGRLDILYNNAGGTSPADGSVTEASIESFWHTIRLDLFGTWLCCRHAIPEMIKGGGGSIINTSSLVAVIGRPGADAYTAAKGAITSLTRSLAVEYARHGIRVNAIGPGATRTDRVVRRLAQGVFPSTLLDRHLLGQLDPLDIAQSALYLASDESRRVTGQLMMVDSGATIG